MCGGEEAGYGVRLESVLPESKRVLRGIEEPCFAVAGRGWICGWIIWELR